MACAQQQRQLGVEVWDGARTHRLHCSHLRAGWLRAEIKHMRGSEWEMLENYLERKTNV